MDDKPGVIMLPPALYGIGLLAVLVMRRFWELPISESGVPFWLGLSFLALGGALALWGQRIMRGAGTNVNPSLPTMAIVTSGPFRISRNPLYLALNLLFLGLTLAINSYWGLIALVLLLPLMHYGVVLREERYLERKFGESYRHYRSRVRRYL
ncbi:MAG TPA: isoprenylcysteine carboxylmethyltransferase family protein [Methyloceanibacter sp.]|nr:isoprenylcysteine carboxylmethyltransferase family protein [Methyloceanibacter sp.]